MNKMLKFFWALACVVLASCGGGGGSGGGSGGGGSGGGTTTPAISVSVALTNAAGQVVTSITAGNAYQAKATVKDASGVAVANRTVTFSINNTAIAVLSQTTALTDASGVAAISISAASFTASGAATLTAAVDLPSTSGTNVTGQGTVDFAVAAAGLTLSPISIATSSLAAGGNTQLSVTALVNNAPLTGTPVNVAFSVSCGRINGSDASGGGVSVATNGSGVAAANYTSVNADGSLCSGNVNITATSAGAAARVATITVAAPIANAISFVSAQPNQIFVAGSGNPEQAVITFKVLAASNTPLAGVSVLFNIVENPGGVGLNASGATAPVTVTTDQSGLVSISVFSGTIPGPVKVRAALASTPSVFAETQSLTIASGPPSQRFMSLSASSHNIEGWVVDGTPTTLTVRIADRQGNAVVDGTIVNFTAEGGQVANSCATVTVNKISSCSVDFRTQNPRPKGGRVSVMAYLSGEKDYDDLNGNNIYDAGDVMKQQGDAFRDDNENKAFDAGEFVVSRGGSLACAGTGGQFASRENTCSSGLSTTVRETAVLLFASSEALTEDIANSINKISFWLGSKNNKLLPMPVGTTITATSSAEGCTVGDITGSPVVDTLTKVGTEDEDLRTQVDIALKGCKANDRVLIKITSPSGLVTPREATLN